MEMLSVLPAGLSIGKSASPGEKLSVRVPPPPHPSFLTVTVMLQGTTSTMNNKADKSIFMPFLVQYLQF